MSEPSPVSETRGEGAPLGRRRQLDELVAELRPELHRYCARMTGSVADGEDVVQDTLIRAYQALPELETLPPLRPWLFRIAQNRALDHLRRYERRMGRPIELVVHTAAVLDPDPEGALARGEAVRAALARFVLLAPAQRSAVILKDVLGHSLDEIAALLELSVPAVKAALHRGRTRLRELNRAADLAPRPPAPEPSPVVARYARLFNARDWDGIRALLADDVRLDVVSVSKRHGRRDVEVYFTNYAAFERCHLVPGSLDGREVLAAFDRGDDRPGYFIEVSVNGERIASIRDYRHVPYILQDAEVVLTDLE